MNHYEIAKNYIQYNPNLKVIICNQHKYAVTLAKDLNEQSNATRHFQEIHKPGLPKSATDAINGYISTLELAEPSQIDMPLKENGPIEGLELYKDGCKCAECGKYAINPKAMDMHFRKCHPNDKPKWSKQPIQTIFSGSNTKYISTLFQY